MKLTGLWKKYARGRRQCACACVMAERRRSAHAGDDQNNGGTLSAKKPRNVQVGIVIMQPWPRGQSECFNYVVCLQMVSAIAVFRLVANLRPRLCLAGLRLFFDLITRTMHLSWHQVPATCLYVMSELRRTWALALQSICCVFTIVSEFEKLALCGLVFYDVGCTVYS